MFKVFKVKLLVVCGLILLTGAWSLSARERTYSFDEPTSANAAIRSMILPGWGQFFNGQPLKGMLFAGAEIGTIAGAFLMYSKANTTYDDYEKQRTESLYDDYSKQIDNTNLFIYLAAAIWAGNIFDAYLSGGSDTEDEDLLSQKFSLEAKGYNQVTLMYRYKF